MRSIAMLLPLFASLIISLIDCCTLAPWRLANARSRGESIESMSMYLAGRFVAGIVLGLAFDGEVRRFLAVGFAAGGVHSSFSTPSIGSNSCSYSGGGRDMFNLRISDSALWRGARDGEGFGCGEDERRGGVDGGAAPGCEDDESFSERSTGGDVLRV
jgi:hypothetical protein